MSPSVVGIAQYISRWVVPSASGAAGDVERAVRRPRRGVGAGARQVRRVLIAHSSTLPSSGFSGRPSRRLGIDRAALDGVRRRRSASCPRRARRSRPRPRRWRPSAAPRAAPRRPTCRACRCCLSQRLPRRGHRPVGIRAADQQQAVGGRHGRGAGARLCERQVVGRPPMSPSSPVALSGVSDDRPSWSAPRRRPCRPGRRRSRRRRRPPRRSAARAAPGPSAQPLEVADALRSVAT